MTAAPTIIVFDSGLGGLTVFREVAAARPDARFVYAADDAFFPYGRQDEADLVARVLDVMEQLIAAHRPDLVVVACNTASTLVLPQLRESSRFRSSARSRRSSRLAHPRAARLVSVLGTKRRLSASTPASSSATSATAARVTLVGSPRLAELAEAALKGEPVSRADRGTKLRPVSSRRRRAHRHRGARLHALSAAARPAGTARDLAGDIDRSGPGHRAPRHRSARPAGPLPRCAPAPIVFTSGRPPHPPLRGGAGRVSGFAEAA